ncbi:MAG: hypothetical protein COV00_00210, partial [Candidatus Tagabacteria bacterium CG10_big_fil_rev_8_21_14_0_10_40_13]
QKGVPCRCPRTPVVERFAFTTGQAGGLGQGQHLFWRRVSQSEIRNLAAAENSNFTNWLGD